jgi:hypothetical protein
MTMPIDLLRNAQSQSPRDAWATILSHAWQVCAASFTSSSPAGEILGRDRELADIDLFLATAGWDLWGEYEASVPLNSNALADWWSNRGPGRAILLLDALSLREVPWILAGAESRGFTVHSAHPNCAEIPPDTTPFAKALGFGQRSSLGSNGAGSNHRLPGARTETEDIPWEDCAAFVGSEPDWVFWHHWPDKDVHDFADAGEGLRPLLAKAAEHFSSDGFWKLVDRFG